MKATGARKVTIVGAGAVGATFAYALAQDGAAEDIALLDAHAELACGQVMDLAHGLPFMPPVHLHVGREADYADSDVVVITAGAKQQAGESRLNLLQRNAAIMREIGDALTRQRFAGVALVVSNPVDVLTQVLVRHLRPPRGRVIGSGTVLDSARFRYLLSQHCGVDARNVHAYILGEHGDSEVAAWSMTHIAGMPVAHYCAVCGRCQGWASVREDIQRQVRDSAYHIIGYKGATWFAVGLALTRIVGAILRDEHSVLTVSAPLEGEYGLANVCLSVPCVVGRAGVERVIVAELQADELRRLTDSAQILRNTVETVEHR